MEGSRWGEFKYDAFNLRTFINATLCPHPAQQLKKKCINKEVGRYCYSSLFPPH
jgi:hypothetical protein